ncbi:related to Protein mmf2, mitochondrial [Cephalotrichum gorgonifer]|uniref:Related to Protein mmf2, mitochondrial n=1 Tax=Cephalotrichum gorgonifer TaxID=2041049 RepID=A0AAE8SVC8_9PEZI|nr:related to Protein mmf2, mitochondrial [Cephalotrichum gorgonifer]
MGLLHLTTFLLATVGSVAAAPGLRKSKSPITHLGDQGPILSGGVASRDLVFVSGTVPSINGTIPDGVEAQTEVIINKIAAILEEAGTSWENALKTTVFLADMDDFAAMNGVYGRLLPNPKPARSTIQAGKLPGDFVVEIEAVVAMPRC